ncbi:MAG: methyltransferase domain-containing protein [Bdellovibrionales bacterium]|nr:methyltransferase domain-containing protein [Bdellovibrionales bacterium]
MAAAITLAGKSLLEVGPDMGQFLDFLREQFGCRTFFSELNQHACAHLKRTGHQSVFDSSAADTRFDIVVMRHVLEHIVQPVQYLCELRERIVDTGILFLEVPDLSFLDSDTSGISFEHVNYFSPATLTRVLDRAGFIIVRQEHALNREYPVARHRVLRMLAVKRSFETKNALLRHIERQRNAITDRVEQELRKLPTGAKIALYGASWLAEKVLKQTGIGSHHLIGIFDKDERKQGGLFCGIQVFDPAEIPAKNPDLLLITSSFEEEIVNYLHVIGYSGDAIPLSALSVCDYNSEQ